MECEGYPIPNSMLSYKQLLRERMQVRLNFLLCLLIKKFPKTALPVDAISRLESSSAKFRSLNNRFSSLQSSFKLSF